MKPGRWRGGGGEGGGRSFHLEHIKKQTHHPRRVGKPGKPSQADNSCERPCHPTDPVTPGCKGLGGGGEDGWAGGAAAGMGRAPTALPGVAGAVRAVPTSHSAAGTACHPLPCTASWVLDVPTSHSGVGAVCHPPSQHHRGSFMPTSTSSPPPLQPSWPRASPQHSPYLNTYRLRTSRHRLQQPRAYHSSATRPLPGKKKNQNIPAGYPASPSLLWFSISICQGGSSTSPSRSLRLCLPGSRLCQTPLAMAASGVSRWAG